MVMALMGPGPGQMQDMPAAGYGPCDPSLATNPYGLAPFRFDTVLVTAARVLDRDGNVLGTLVAPGARVVAFTRGDGDEATDQGWPAGFKKSCVETMTYEKGALVERGENFKIEGLGVRVLRPFVLDENGNRTYPAWLDAYEARMREAVLEGLCVDLKFGKDRCEWVVGAPGDWPQNGGAVGSGVVSNGAGAAIGVYLPLTAAAYSGAVDEPNKLQVRISTGSSGLAFPNDPDGVRQQADVKIALKVTLHGRRVCAPCEPVCVPSGATQGQVQQALLEVLKGLSPAQRAQLLGAAANGGK